MVNIGRIGASEAMSNHNLEIYYRITYGQITQLLDLIMSPDIDDIRYIWHRHECPLTRNYFTNTVWMRNRRLAVVTFDMWSWPSIQEFLVWFYARIIESGILVDEIGRSWARKTNPHYWLCIC